MMAPGVIEILGLLPDSLVSQDGKEQWVWGN